MPQKKAKKPAKVEKAKKPGKAAPKAAKAGGLGAALKKVAKDIGKKIGAPAPVAKKPVAPPVKKGVPAKPEKLAKKVAAPAVAPIAAAKGKKGASSPALTLVKGKKDSVAPAPAAKGGKALAPVKGKKGEVVVVVPAPKGVAVIAKDGKKKGKAAAEGAALKKNRCREPGCDHDFSLMGYCRLHYIKNWRRIKRKEGILASGQLNNYVEELVSKYPDKYLDVIRQDLASEKEWGKAVVDLELEGADEEGGAEEDIDTAAEGVRTGGGGGGSPRGGEFDDEGDAF